MQWKLGDFVRFVDERREGYITRIFDNGMVGVTGDDDFEIPVPANKITTVYGHNGVSENVDSRTDTKSSSITAEENFVRTGIYLAAITDPKIASVVRFSIVNNTSFQLLVSFGTGSGIKIKGEYAGIIQPNKVAEIFTAQLGDIQLWPAFNIQALYFTPQITDLPKPLIFIEKFKAKDFAGAKKIVPLINQHGWLFRLDDQELIIDPEKLKESFYKPAEEKRDIEKPLTEVDLHIEKLRNDYQFIAPAEILAIQLNHFHKTLDAAIVHKLPELVFIHGTGNGILRHQIHKLLGKNLKVETFMDARKEKFGFGATRVVLK